MHDAASSRQSFSLSNPAAGMIPAANFNAGQRPVLLVLGLALLVYLLAAVLGMPQAATEMITGGAVHAVADTAHAAEAHAPFVPPYFTVLPFVLLLGAIAVFPLMHATEHW